MDIDDVWRHVLTFLMEDEFKSLKKVNKQLHRLVKLKYITNLVIDKESTYLLNFKFNNLKVLHCSWNQLTSIPFIPGLEVLHCSWNQLTSIPLILGLKVLYCNGNQLTSIPLIPGLEVLVCSENQLTSIPSIPRLKKLYCGC